MKQLKITSRVAASPDFIPCLKLLELIFPTYPLGLLGQKGSSS